MDRITSWASAGAGFTVSTTPSTRRPTASSSTSRSTNSQSRKPKPPNTASRNRAPPKTSKQPLLFSLDKTPLVTPRESNSTRKPGTASSTQSKLSQSSFIERRKPLQEKSTNRLSTQRSTGRGKSRKRETLEFDDEYEEEDGDDDRSKPEPRRNERRTNVSSRSNSSDETTNVAISLLDTSTSSAFRWEGKLSTRKVSQSDTTSSHGSITARKILYPPKDRNRGPTIEFDGEDLEVGASEDEMKGEEERRKRKKWDLGGFGKLDLVDSGDVEDYDLERRRRVRDLREGNARKSDTEEETSTLTSKPIRPRTERTDPNLPRPRPSSTLPLSQYRSTRQPVSSDSTTTSSAEVVQARLVPTKRPARVLVPDSDELTPPANESEEEGEEPDTELDDDEVAEIERTETRVVKKEEDKGTVGERSDDSGFVEMIDLSHLPSSSSSDPGQQRIEVEEPVTEEGEQEDDLESIPDSQPSIASHLSRPLGSSPPPPRSDASIMILEPTTRPSPRPFCLKPSDSAILMPPPPPPLDSTTTTIPRKRLRRGPPPRVLAEETQYPLSHSPSTDNTTITKQRFRIFCEETQSESLPPPLIGPPPPRRGEAGDGLEMLKRWNEENVRLPSDLPDLSSDQIVLPQPPPRPPKELAAAPTKTIQEGKSLEEEEKKEEGDGSKRKDDAWTSLDSAWSGQLPIPPPPPVPPRQSRLTDHFALTLEERSRGGGRGEIVEDSQGGGQGEGKGFELEALERAVRDSIQGLGCEKDLYRAGRGNEQEEEEEETLRGSSPLSSLSPSLPPSSPPPQPLEDEEEEDRMELDEQGAGDGERDGDEVVPDSEPEEDFVSFSTRRPLASIDTSFFDDKFPKYVLPSSVLRLEWKGKQGEEEIAIVGEEEEKGRDVVEEPEESLWESYWTLGSAPQPSHGDDDCQDDGNGEGGGKSKTVAELLFAGAPDVDIPSDWVHGENGELVMRVGRFEEVDEEGEL
ncbi:hypothetical protein JCM16303_007343 [Sporobolomyces ruberrimus]